MKDYTIGGVTVKARNWRTAERRVRGYNRGEFDINGATIPCKDRNPPRPPMKKRKKK